MSTIVVSGDTSGSITLAAPAVAGTNTITMPAQTGNMMVNGPAFSVYVSSNQSISTSANVKIPFNAKVFDTASCFDNTTNYRFTPNVAGYYQFNLKVQMQGTPGDVFCTINKTNGTEIYRGSRGVGGLNTVTASAVMYLNGSTDYVEAYIYSSNVAGITGGAITSGDQCYFNGAMVRGA